MVHTLVLTYWGRDEWYAIIWLQFHVHFLEWKWLNSAYEFKKYLEIWN